MCCQRIAGPPRGLASRSPQDARVRHRRRHTAFWLPSGQGGLSSVSNDGPGYLRQIGTFVSTNGVLSSEPLVAPLL